MDSNSEIIKFIKQQNFKIDDIFSLNVCLHSILTGPNPVINSFFLSKFIVSLLKLTKWKFFYLFPKIIEYGGSSPKNVIEKNLKMDGVMPLVAAEFAKVLTTKFCLTMNEIKDFMVILQGKCNWNQLDNSFDLVNIKQESKDHVWVVVLTLHDTNVLGFVVFNKKTACLYVTNQSYITAEKKQIKCDSPIIVVSHY